MKIKYKLRTIDKVDNFVDSVDLITKIINVSNEWNKFTQVVDLFFLQW